MPSRAQSNPGWPGPSLATLLLLPPAVSLLAYVLSGAALVASWTFVEVIRLFLVYRSPSVSNHQHLDTLCDRMGAGVEVRSQQMRVFALGCATLECLSRVAGKSGLEGFLGVVLS